jgi:drug/metabolite transporter (DMT)-like permease
MPAGGDATPALVALMRSLSGSGTSADAQGPSHAGGPIGPALLIAFAIALALGAVALWWWLRRPPRPRRKPRRRRPLGDLVEIDHEGNIIRRTPAAERERRASGTGS